MDYQVEIKRQKRKNMLMRVKPGGVVVFIPRWMKSNSPQVREFIKEGLNKLQEHIPPVRPQQTSPEEIRLLVDQWAARMGLAPQRITLRDMRRKWGSCSSRGNITLNIALCTVPRPLAEYVIVHELAHLKVFDHSAAFWALVAEYLPDYENSRKTLDSYPV
jgi:predicted metal-dependent hydrolase